MVWLHVIVESEDPAGIELRNLLQVVCDALEIFSGFMQGSVFVGVEGESYDLLVRPSVMTVRAASAPGVIVPAIVGKVGYPNQAEILGYDDCGKMQDAGLGKPVQHITNPVWVGYLAPSLPPH